MCHRNVYTQECAQGSIKDFEFGGLHKVLSGRVLGGGGWGSGVGLGVGLGEWLLKKTWGLGPPIRG